MIGRSAYAIEVGVLKTRQTLDQGSQAMVIKQLVTGIIGQIELEILLGQKIKELDRRVAGMAEPRRKEFEIEGDVRAGGEHPLHPSKHLQFPTLDIDFYEVGPKHGQKLI